MRKENDENTVIRLKSVFEIIGKGTETDDENPILILILFFLLIE